MSADRPNCHLTVNGGNPPWLLVASTKVVYATTYGKNDAFDAVRIARLALGVDTSGLPVSARPGCCGWCTCRGLMPTRYTPLCSARRGPSADLMRSITWDKGTGMARRPATTNKLGAAVYSCDSRPPWQRGSNENTNALSRLFRQGVSLTGHLPEHLAAVEHELNNHPRKGLQYRIPPTYSPHSQPHEVRQCCHGD